MCRLATAHDRRIKVFDYEIKHKLGGETYNLVKKLMSEDFAKDQYDFSTVIGMDNANSFDKWVNYKDLEKMMRFVVVPRTGIKIEHKSNWYLKPPHMFLVPEKQLPEISSTNIRDNFEIMWREGHVSSGMAYQFIKKHLNGDVFDYIRENKLYV
jgi:nicotinate-nucleotide adenylyltransferase